jgi:hypothetical protein
MPRRLTVVSARAMPHSREAVREAIWDIKSIELTERKADHVEVHPDTPRRGLYRVHGHFAGVPWRNAFIYELNDGGFHSRNADVAPEDATIEGGFIVTPLADGCTVIHYEQYVLAPWLRPVALLVRGYLRWSMRGELRDLERLVAAGGRVESATPTAVLAQ